MPKWMIGVLALFVVVYSVTVLLTGEPSYLIPMVILVLVLCGIVAVNAALTRRIVRRDGSLEEAMSDNEDPIPSTHIIPDDTTAAGDTPEAHDEITQHDLPLDHPGRQAAEQQTAGQSGTTRGHEQGGAQGE